MITARDIKSGEELHCEAKIAKIERIQIITRHKVLLIKEIETLEVQGYDALGNVFSSL